MPRLAIILLLSCAYIGCAGPVTVPGGPVRGDRPGRPRPGGTVRVLVGAGLSAEALARAAVARPLAEGGLASSVVRPAPARGGAEPDSGCWRFEIDPGRRIDGAPVRPQAIVAAWERGLRDSAEPHRWLLEPVRGADAFAVGLVPRVEGLRAEEGALAVCTSGPTPDLPLRLAHPALWFPRPAGASGPLEGPGPFRRDASGILVPQRGPAGERPYLDRVEPVPDRGAPGLLLRLGEADLGVVLGADAGELLDRPDEPLRLERVEAWDRVYYLWLDPARRWVNDPRFRLWLGSVIDREAMLAYLFDGRGEPAAGLLPGPPLEPPAPAPSSRPLSAASRPRLDLCYDAADPLAASIAARVRAVLDLHQVELTADPRDPPGLIDALSRGRASIVLLAHRPGLADPVLALTESLADLPGLPADAREALREGAREVGPRERQLAARRVEARLVREGHLIPLVRLHAWLAVDPALRGVRTGSDGSLFLERAWWAR